ncbi:MAG TPA: DNA polymerase III subunit chi [Malonomonas sp.]
MTKVLFAKLEQPQKADLLCRLAEEYFSAGKRVLVLVQDDNQAVALDRFMWSCDKGTFLPHAFYNGSVDCLEEPIVITVREGNPNGASVLIMGQPCSPEFIGRFELAVDFAEVFDKRLAEQSRERFRSYRALGFDPQMC